MIRTFNEWLEKTNGLYVSVDNWKEIKSWLKNAFDAGYDAGEMNKEFLIQDLKREIRTQRKEIGALREEKRFLLDNDNPPGYNDYWHKQNDME